MPLLTSVQTSTRKQSAKANGTKRVRRFVETRILMATHTTLAGSLCAASLFSDAVKAPTSLPACHLRRIHLPTSPGKSAHVTLFLADDVHVLSHLFQRSTTVNDTVKGCQTLSLEPLRS